MSSRREETRKPAWDAGIAGELTGERVLFGVAYLEPRGAWQEQVFGRVPNWTGHPRSNKQDK
jgi:hypothetical protein